MLLTNVLHCVQPDCQRSARRIDDLAKIDPPPASKAVLGATCLHPDPHLPASGQHRLHPENLGSRKNFFEGGYLRLSCHTPSHNPRTASFNLANLSPMRKGEGQVF